jgi:hypothetical protein
MSLEETLEMNDREEALYFKIIELREYLKLVKDDEKEKERTRDKILILQHEICKYEYEGHDYNENDKCRKCGLVIEDDINFSTSFDFHEGPKVYKKLYEELGLEYNEEDF